MCTGRLTTDAAPGVQIVTEGVPPFRLQGGSMVVGIGLVACSVVGTANNKGRPNNSSTMPFHKRVSIVVRLWERMEPMGILLDEISCFEMKVVSSWLLTG